MHKTFRAALPDQSAESLRKIRDLIIFEKTPTDAH
jgi:hypothetical protein